MAEEGRVQLKTYFETGDKPTEAQFINLIDSESNRTDDLKFEAADPDVDKDELNGYKIKDRILNTVTNVEFLCKDNTTGAAVWVSATGDASLTAAAGADIPIKMGDAVGANKVSFKDSASAEVATLDSDGNFAGVDIAASGDLAVNGTITGNVAEWNTAKDYAVDKIIVYLGAFYKSRQTPNVNKNPVTETTYWDPAGVVNAKNIIADTGDDILVKMGDDAGANYVRFKSFSGSTAALLNSLGAFSCNGITDLGDLVITGATTGAAAVWYSGKTYLINDKVNHSGVTYISLQGVNLGKDPSSEPTWWTEDKPVPTTYVEWSGSVTYAINKMITYSGWQYVSLQNANTGNTPALAGTLWWAPAPRITSLTEVTDVGDLDWLLVSTGGDDGIGKMSEGTLFAGTDRYAAEWDSAYTYDEHQSIYYLGKPYASLADSNTPGTLTGNRPSPVCSAPAATRRLLRSMSDKICA